jgi:hypothetical protein
VTKKNRCGTRKDGVGGTNKRNNKENVYQKKRNDEDL